MDIKVEMTRDEVCNMLGVSKDGMKYIIKNGKLKDRIDNSGYGYTYIGQKKEGRSIIYELEYCGSDTWLQFQNHYRIRDKYKHTKYTETRIDNLDKPRNTVVSISDVHITDRTAKRYDDILLNESMIGEDKMVYVKYNFDTKQFVEITEEEYKMFWKDNRVIKNAIGDVYRRKAKGELSEGMASYSIVELTQNSSVEGWVAYKFMSYKELDEAKKLREWLSNRKK